MKPQYEPKTEQQHLGYLVEEAGEVLAAAGKSLRWGPDSFNPELPVSKRESNADWLWREMHDLEGALSRMAAWLRQNGYPEDEKMTTNTPRREAFEPPFRAPFRVEPHYWEAAETKISGYQVFDADEKLVCLFGGYGTERKAKWLCDRLNLTPLM